eukprot:1606106-Pleurochrysis_carterae.AAC.1
MFTAVVKLHLVSAVGCLATIFIHTYWIHGSHILGLAEHSNPTLVTHVSRVDFGPAFDYTSLAIKRVAAFTPGLIVRTAHTMNEIDENINNVVVDFVIASPSVFAACLRRSFASPPSETFAKMARPSPSRTRSKCLPLSIATQSY